jgi:hypothetical protein
MHQDLKERLRSFLPEYGLHSNESFMIRFRYEHSRGGTDKTFYLCIDHLFNFYCIIDILETGHFNNGHLRTFHFYVSGKIPLQIQAGLEFIKKQPTLKSISDAYSNFDSYEGNFDITYKTEDFGCSYLDYNSIEFFPNENPKSYKKVIDKHLTKKLSNLQTEIVLWMNDLDRPFRDMLIKGAYSFEIDFK